MFKKLLHEENFESHHRTYLYVLNQTDTFIFNSLAKKKKNEFSLINKLLFGLNKYPARLLQIDLNGLAFRINDWVPHRGSPLPKQRPH